MEKILSLSSVRRVCFISIALLLSTLCSCHERELCYDHSHVSPVNVSFDWSEAVDATPGTMVVWFFPVDGSQDRRYELLDLSKYYPEYEGRGGSVFDTQIMVAPGEYYVLCHNGSTENNIESGNTFDNYCLSTYDDNLLSPLNRTATAPRPDVSEQQPVRMPANELWAHALETTVRVEQSATTPVEVRFTPARSHVTCHIKISDVKNLSPTLDISAIITGVAESYSPSLGLCGGSEVTVPFKVSHCGSDCLTATVIIFGDNAPHDVCHWLRLYTSYNYYYDFNITDQIHAAAGRKDIYINLSGLNLHTPGGGGLQPGVGGWKDSEKQDIIM